MRKIAKLAMGAVLLAGTAAASAAPANAGVAVGISLGVPGVAVGYGNPCYRPIPYRPAYCYPAYYQPLFIDGAWTTGPVYYRTFGGARYFWVHNGWARDRDDFHRDRDNFRGGHDWRGDRDGSHR